MEENFSLQSLADYLKGHDNYIVTSHEAPDGDAIGSEIAFFKMIRKLGKKAVILNSDRTEDKYQFLDTEQDIHHIKDPEALPDNIADCILIVLDTEPGNIGWLQSHLLQDVKEIITIDHHDYEIFSGCSFYIKPRASSTSEIVFDLMEKLGVSMDLSIANALFTGIVYDTGSFKYPKTSARTLEIGSKLISHGIEPYKIHSRLHESKSTEFLLLQRQIIKTLKLHFNQSVAVQVMTREMLELTGGSYEEAQEIVDYPLQSEQVRVSIFMKEDETGKKRCSIRTKGEVDCTILARHFHGGGHKTAAGFSVNEDFDSMIVKVLDRLKPFFPE